MEEERRNLTFSTVKPLTNYMMGIDVAHGIEPQNATVFVGKSRYSKPSFKVQLNERARFLKKEKRRNYVASFIRFAKERYKFPSKVLKGRGRCASKHICYSMEQKIRFLPKSSFINQYVLLDHAGGTIDAHVTYWNDSLSNALAVPKERIDLERIQRLWDSTMKQIQDKAKLTGMPIITVTQKTSTINI
jgi:hypothetical protein